MKTRNEELLALSETITVLNDDDSLELPSYIYVCVFPMPSVFTEDFLHGTSVPSATFGNQERPRVRPLKRRLVSVEIRTLAEFRCGIYV